MSIYRGAGGAGDAVNDSSSEATLIQQLAIEAQDSADAAATSETNAAASETAAASSASAASTSASNAATSATNASNSASSASTSATNAANSATAAQTAETAAELAETNAETAETNAASSASAASTSASNAATSATNASNSASSASTSATNASNSASAASTSASNASTSATAAASSASAASTSASNASTSETNAASSASSASASASTATTQAGIATTQATNAASSASAAATSATNASNSASAASTSATNASNSQTAAAASAAEAAASFDAFDDIYLGAKASNPTVDNDGDALTTGDQYFNTVSNELRVWNGSSWQAASVVGGTVTTLTVTGSAVANTFSSSGATITGGSINNTPIGATTANTGAFTTLGASGVATFSAGTVSAPAITTTGDTNTGIFFPAADTIAFTEGGVEAARFDSSGNLGIGTSNTVNSKLYVSNLNIAQLIIGYNNTSENYFDANTQIFRTAGATEVMRTTSTGLVGIGLTNPGARLDISGNFFATGYGRFGGSLAFIGKSSDLVSGGSATDTAFRYDGNNLVFAYSNTERMRITSAGNVGIGTTSPNQRLDIVTTSGVAAARFSNGTGVGICGIDNFNNGYLSTESNHPFLFVTNGTERMRIDSSGNLGIGTTTPSSFSDPANNLVVGTTSGNNGITIVGGTTGLSSIYLADGTTGNEAFRGSIEYGHTNDYMAFATAASERMRIDSAGNVGIGTTSPASSRKLDVQSAQTSTTAFANRVIRVASNASGADATINFTDNTLYNSYIGSGAGDIYFGTNGAIEVLRVNGSGNLVLKGGTAAAGGVGITFPATQSASSDANTLDDYEEGTFTPTVVGSTTDGTGTYTIQVGSYTKIGKLVSVAVRVAWTAHTGTGNIRFGNLPFAAKNLTNYFAVASISPENIVLTANNIGAGWVSTNTSYVSLVQLPVGGGAADNVAMDTSGSTIYSVLYETDN